MDSVVSARDHLHGQSLSVENKCHWLLKTLLHILLVLGPDTAQHMEWLFYSWPKKCPQGFQGRIKTSTHSPRPTDEAQSQSQSRDAARRCRAYDGTGTGGRQRSSAWGTRGPLKKGGKSVLQRIEIDHCSQGKVLKEHDKKEFQRKKSRIMKLLRSEIIRRVIKLEHKAKDRG